LIPNLSGRHNAEPVHSLEEIARLKELFPDNILQFNVYHNDANCRATIFESGAVAHCQYISKFETNQIGSLEFYLIIHKRFVKKRF
jgi:hypothetical protein